VQAIIDVRKDSNGDLAKKVKELGINIFFNHAVIDTKGRKKINSVTISELNESLDKTIGKSKELSCDLLCVSGGWTPTVHLFSQSKGKLFYRESDATFIPDNTFSAIIIACYFQVASSTSLSFVIGNISRTISWFFDLSIISEIIDNTMLGLSSFEAGHMIVSAALMAFTALTVNNSGSPGPHPTQTNSAIKNHLFNFLWQTIL